MDISTTVGREVNALGRDGKGLSILTVATAWGLLVGVRMIYPVLLPSLQETYGLSLSVAGLLVTVLWLFSSLGQLPGGVFADRYDERLLMAVSSVAVAVALVFVVTATVPVVLFLATALWGIGASFFPVARITLLSNLYPDRLGSALGLTMAAGDIGQTVLPPFAAGIAVALSWQLGLGFVVPLILLGGVAIFVCVPPQRPCRADDSLSLKETLSVTAEFRNPEIGIVVIVLFLYLLIWQSFTAFYPTYLTSVKDLSPSVASVLFGFFFVVGVFVKPLAGVAYDRLDMRSSLILVLLPSVAGLVLLPVVESLTNLVLVTALVSTMLGSGAITQSYLADAFSADVQGAGLGVTRSVTMGLAAGGPVLFGAIADYGHFDWGYVALAATMALVILLTMNIPRS